MTLQQLIYIVKIAELKSMNKAAAELYVSQPALSATIKDVEKEINMSVFFRSNKGISVTPEGEEFLKYARQMVELGDVINERFIETKEIKKKFSVSMQHYSFAVDAFIRLASEFGMDEYEFAVHETKTIEVIENVRNHRSEVGVLFVNDFNEKVINKIFKEDEVEFIPLFKCNIYVYLSKKHPLSKKKSIAFEELSEYPCLAFEQGERNSFYLAEEVLSTRDYAKIIRTDDRATMLNLMVGLNGYTLCSGIISENINGDAYAAVPLESDEVMTIGYIKRKNMPLSILGEKYVGLLKEYEKDAMLK